MIYSIYLKAFKFVISDIDMNIELIRIRLLAFKSKSEPFLNLLFVLKIKPLS